MIRRVLQAAAALSAFLVASCTPPGGAPPSARTAIPDSAEGLMELYRRECVEVRSRAWIRDESARLRAACPRIMVREPKWRDCQYIEDGHASWRVLTKSGSSVMVKMLWPREGPPGPPSDWRMTCTIDVDERLRRALRTVAHQAARMEGMSAEPRHEASGEYETWTWSYADAQETGPWLQLVDGPAEGASLTYATRDQALRYSPRAAGD